MQCRRSFLAAGLGICLEPCFKRAAAQEPTFSTEVKVVSVLVNVQDKKGHLISDLEKNDFVLFEQGRPQEIKYFARQSDLPLVLGLMIDTSVSQNRVMDQERTACFHFVDEVLRENKDKLFILQFDMTVYVREELTSSWKDLNDSLAGVDTPTRGALRGQTGGGTLLYDAVLKGASVMKEQHGRKAMIILSDGVDTGSDSGLADAIDAAQKADALIYSILFSDAGAYGILGEGRIGRNALEKLARDSGGSFFEVTKKLSIDQIFAAIQIELRNQYSLGYISDQPVRVSEFREIDVRLGRKDLRVQARKRYWAKR